MVNKVVRWGNRNPFLMSLIMNTSLVVVLGWAITNEGNQNDRQLEAETVARAKALAASAIVACEQAARAVTNAGKADDLAILNVIKGRFAESGRPVPPIYLALEATIAARQPPVEACTP
jgi:hypothetical protein